MSDSLQSGDKRGVDAMEHVEAQGDTKRIKSTDHEDASPASPVSLGGVELDTQLDDAIQTYDTAELAVLQLMRKFDFDFELLKTKITNRGLNVSFSNVKYSQIAPLVGLKPNEGLRDASTFEVKRARLPLLEFKAIVAEVQQLMKQYGIPLYHSTEEARSRYTAAPFNRIVSFFDSMIINTPESLMEGRMTKKGQIEYQYKIFGGCTIVFVEMKLQVGSWNERLNNIAQAIAKADACEFTNRKEGYLIPVLGVLTDGQSFEFFRFDIQSKFAYGVITIQSEPVRLIKRLTLPQLDVDGAESYVSALKPVCEVFYWLFLNGFVSGIDGYLRRSKSNAAREGKQRDSTEVWTSALAKAISARDAAVEGAILASKGDITTAESKAEESLQYIKESTALIPEKWRTGVNLFQNFNYDDILKV